MTDQLIRVILHGPIVDVTGYGLTETEAWRMAEQAVQAQVALIERERAARAKPKVKRYTVLSGKLEQL